VDLRLSLRRHLSNALWTSIKANESVSKPLILEMIEEKGDMISEILKSKELTGEKTYLGLSTRYKKEKGF